MAQKRVHLGHLFMLEDEEGTKKTGEPRKEVAAKDVIGKIGKKKRRAPKTPKLF
jgi:hypothetical protein